MGTQLLGGRAKLGEFLKTVAEDAMLSTPDQLDPLSRRFDAARHGGGPARQNQSANKPQKRPGELSASTKRDRGPKAESK